MWKKGKELCPFDQAAAEAVKKAQAFKDKLQNYKQIRMHLQYLNIDNNARNNK